MNVNELIEKLSLVEDKSARVVIALRTKDDFFEVADIAVLDDGDVQITL